MAIPSRRSFLNIFWLSLGFVALIRGLVQSNIAQGCLGLLLLLLATMVKNEAVVWLYVAAGTCLFSIVRGRISLLLIGLAAMLLTAAWLTGSFLVEWIFSIPGIGKFFVTSVTRDRPRRRWSCRSARVCSRDSTAQGPAMMTKSIGLRGWE